MRSARLQPPFLIDIRIVRGDPTPSKESKGCSMNDFTALVGQFGEWLKARKLDPQGYSLAIVARDEAALSALRGELDASLQREDWRPAWKTGCVEVRGIAIATTLRDDAASKPPDRDFRVSDLPAAIFWPLVIVQIAFFAWLIFTTVAWWRV